MKRYRSRIIMGLALGFGVIVATALLSDVNALLAQAIVFPWIIMVPVLGLRVVNWGLRFIKWHFYLDAVGVKNLRVGENLVIFLAGFPLTLSPGKMAQVLRSVFLKTRFGAPIAVTLPVVFAERISDGVAVLLMLMASIIGLAATEYWPVAIISFLIFAAGIALLQNRRASLWLLDKAVRLPLVRRFAAPLRDFYESSNVLVRWRSIVVALGLALGGNFLDAVGVYLILLGLGLPPGMTLFLQAVLIISLSVTVGAISALPGGLGAADLSIGVTMQTIAGLALAEAGFATLLVGFAQLWFGVLVGMAVGFVYRDVLLVPEAEAQDLAAEIQGGAARQVSEGVRLR